MEILAPNQYTEYEDFVKNHPNGSLMQSIKWHNAKPDWGHEVIAERDENGKIVAGVSVLIKKIPLFGTSMLYAPRGPVCFYDDIEILKKLQAGIDTVAKKYKAHIFKVDPDAPFDNTLLCENYKKIGYKQFAGPTGFENIQTRFNFRLYIDGRTEEKVLAGMHHKTRYNIRLASRKGVTVEVKGKEALDDFMRLMEVTGERDGFSIRSKQYFENMMDALGKNIRLYMGYYDGKAITGAITSNYAAKTCYIYGASDNEYRNVMGPYLLQWEMIKWAIETGCDVYDFMGVSGDMDENGPLYGLYRFKNGFSGQVDELVGEFDYIYKPFVNSMINGAIKANEIMRDLKRKIK